LGYQGFPAPICISVNEQVVHGIPGKQVLQTGDIVGLDLGVTYNKMITDGAVQVAVGSVTADVQRLLDATQDALGLGIAQARAGNQVGDISAAIERRLRADGLGVMVPNYGKAGRGPVLKPGMTIAIEPMATLGGKYIQLSRDNWTIVTADGSWAAQFEHTVLITEDAPEILTTLR
jgi:methionyl aminopeptidase